MNVLVLGSGGREHALAGKISESKLLDKLYCMPGNPGTASFATNISGNINDFKEVKARVIENKIDLVVVGPEEPLVRGIRDFFENDDDLKDVLFIGPDLRGAMLEGSKEFAKKFMCKYHIPTAAYRSFTSAQEEDAFMFLKTLTPPYVLKADGLAAGKGVLIVKNYDEACKSLSEMLSGKFGEASGKVVIEQFLSGIEVSSFILTDGKDYLLLPEAKDYKRIGDGDTGLNTGGMGAVSPVPFFDDVFRKKVEERIIIPTVKGIQAEGYRYSGFVFIGLMNCGGDPYVIEYNVRMGDPETESVMMRIKSDFLSHLVAAARGNLSLESLKITEKTALTTVVVSGGYPESYVKGYKIDGLDILNNITVFHSGTAFNGDTTVTSGGRVLALTALGESIDDAREIIYSQIDKIRFTDINYRKDIGLDLE
jgi:phosphoribosylamine---glycine ligase